ncbi:hypothetical protein V3W47_08605 [Deinococcus sp. YIM 134068]|uniref:hypothetical protein n=1 Tax=Deinococcus lichenicola TaxID=3118910 RepID=UPI002F93DE7B
MKSRMGMVALLVGATVGNAQSWQGGHGQYQLGACYSVSTGVRCDLTYTLQEDQNQLQFNTDLFETTTTDGKTLKASKVAAAGGTLDSRTGFISMYRNVPVKVSVLFAIPTTTTSLRVLTIENIPWENIPVRNPSVPGPSTTPVPAGAAVNLGTTQAVVGGKAYTVSLTHCKLNAGKYVCTATVTPGP